MIAPVVMMMVVKQNAVLVGGRRNGCDGQQHGDENPSSRHVFTCFFGCSA